MTGHQQPIWLLVLVVAIAISVAALRVAWVWLSLQLTLFRSAERRSTPNWRIVAAMSFAGVRGAITLAGVLTLPLTMMDGSEFPARDLAIFLAMGVIILSLIAASIALPWLLSGLELPADPSYQAEEDVARISTARAAIAAVERAQRDLAIRHGDTALYIETAARVMGPYRQRIENRQGSAQEHAHGRLSERIERDLRLAALKAERSELLRMVHLGTLRDELARQMIRELDLLEARYPG